MARFRMQRWVRSMPGNGGETSRDGFRGMRRAVRAAVLLPVVLTFGLVSPSSGCSAIHVELPDAILKGHGRLAALAFSPDGDRLATGGADGSVDIWDLRRRRIAAHFKCPAGIEALQYSRSGDRLAAAGSDGTLALWNVGRAELASTLHFASPVFSLVYSPDDRMLVTASHDGTVRVRDSAGKLMTTFDRKVDSTISAFEAEGVSYVVGMLGSELLKWNLQTLQPVGPPWPSSSPARWTGQLILSPDGRWLAVPDALQEIPLFGLVLIETGSGRRWPGGMLLGSHIAFSSDSKRMAAQSASAISVFDVESAEELMRLRPDDRDPFPVTIAFSRDGSVLAAGFDDGIIRIWRLWRLPRSVR
jgi:WD40 repeat protein